MKSLITIAWRNCWRNPTRSMIVIFSIIVGLWASLFMMGFMEGLTQDRKTKGIDSFFSHIQIESESFNYDQDVINSIPDLSEVRKVLDQDPKIESYTERFITESLLMTAREQRGAQLIAVDAEQELATLELGHKLVEGEFFGDAYTRPILIGEKMSEELKVGIGSKIVLTFTNIDSIQVAENFKVSGIYKSGNSGYDAYHVFVPREIIYDLTGKEIVHRILVKTNVPEELETYKVDILGKELGHVNGIVVLSWRDSSPELAMADSVFEQYIYIMMAIIVIALLFGIINTITMSILERKREIGVLLAVGMNRRKIRLMIALESLIYGLIGGPVGIILGLITIIYFGNNGLDMSAYASGFEAYGLSSVIYFSLESKFYIAFGVLILSASFLGGLYPARIATSLDPIEAIRSI